MQNARSIVLSRRSESRANRAGASRRDRLAWRVAGPIILALSAIGWTLAYMVWRLLF